MVNRERTWRAKEFLTVPLYAGEVSKWMRIRKAGHMSVLKWKKLHRDERGATAIEYGLLAALIAISAVGAFQGFGNGLIDMWGFVSDTSEEVMGS
ncbi:MAG: Flp family type IVb pilin [Pseudomonadota bacterium]